MNNKECVFTTLFLMNLSMFPTQAWSELNTDIIGVLGIKVNSQDASIWLSPTFSVNVSAPQLLFNNANTATLSTSTGDQPDQYNWQSLNSMLLSSPSGFVDTAIGLNHKDSDLLQEELAWQKSDDIVLVSGLNVQSGTRVKHRAEVGFSTKEVSNFVNNELTTLSVNEERIHYSLGSKISPYVSTTLNTSIIVKDSGAEIHSIDAGIDSKNYRRWHHLDMGNSITYLQPQRSQVFTSNWTYTRYSESSDLSFGIGVNQADTTNVFELTDQTIPLNLVSEVMVSHAQLSIQKVKLSEQITLTAGYEVGRIETINKLLDEQQRFDTEYDAGDVKLVWNVDPKSHVSSELNYSILDDTASWSGVFAYSSVLNSETHYTFSFSVGQSTYSAKAIFSYQPHRV